MKIAGGDVKGKVSVKLMFIVKITMDNIRYFIEYLSSTIRVLVDFDELYSIHFIIDQ